jgi:hypothetical protein
MNVVEELKSAVLEAFKPVLKPLVIKIMKTIVFPILKEKAQATATPIDDLVLASIETSALDAIEKLEF